MSLGAVLALSRNQIFDVILWNRDKDGRAEFAEGEDESPLAKYVAAMVKAGIPYPLATSRAREYLAAAGDNGD